MKSCALASVAYPLAMLSFFSLGIPAAVADTYPVRPVKIITPGPAGTGADVIIRIVAEGLSRRWGHQVYVENTAAGRFGLAAAQAAAASEADGYTLFQPAASTFVSLPQMPGRLPIDIDRAFMPVGFVGEQPMVIAVGSSSEITTLPELIAQAKKRPGDLLYAGNQLGTLPHVTGQLLRERAGIDLGFIPYPGTARALPDVMTGRITIIIDGTAGLLGVVKGGEVRAIAVASEKRLPEFPELATVAEAIPGFVSTGWTVLVAPTNTPQWIVDKVNQDLRAVLGQAAIKERFATLGTYSRDMSLTEVGRFIRSEQELWKPIVKQIAVTP
jgi:tripartite-type tricarboxylate transporter receptor subunit TctC